MSVLIDALPLLVVVVCGMCGVGVRVFGLWVVCVPWRGLDGLYGPWVAKRYWLQREGTDRCILVAGWWLWGVGYVLEWGADSCGQTPLVARCDGVPER